MTNAEVIAFLRTQPPEHDFTIVEQVPGRITAFEPVELTEGDQGESVLWIIREQP